MYESVKSVQVSIVSLPENSCKECSEKFARSALTDSGFTSEISGEIPGNLYQHKCKDNTKPYKVCVGQVKS
jgi:hypothetical protein